MADSEKIHSSIDLLKNSKILVNVEEALPDILVVTYKYESKIFQGVLLDSTKKNLPCGISPSLSQLSQASADTSKSMEGVEEDRLVSVGQRFTYYQDKLCSKTSDHTNHNKYLFKRQIRPPARYRNTRMNIRLRPRQVLCSKCRSICNENSENVDLTQKRCSENNSTSNKPEKLVGLSGELLSNKSPRPLFSENQRDNQPMYASHTKESAVSPLIPKVKIPRLQPSEIANALIGNTNKIKIVGNYWVSRPEPEKEPVEVDKEETDHKLYCVVEREVGKRMELRKKRSMGSMEDLWDETVLDDVRPTRTTPIIKISFGQHGEGTVLEIPSRRHDCHGHSDTTKAAKRAIKKAKKEARRKLLRAVSPAPSRGLASPAGGALPIYETLYRRRHKRNKVKHKKKHKDERKYKEDSNETGDFVTDSCFDIPTADVTTYSDMKEDCLRQKLSIKLSRLSANAYQRCDLIPSSSKSSTSSELSDDHGEAVPNFPPPETRLMDQCLNSCMTRDGRQMVVGDIVWGKIHGFPWWPGKVLSITVSSAGVGSLLEPRAHVSWYGSSTSSDMPCEQLSPFLETFKVRYNKKKRGPYKEAIRQATCEAQKKDMRHLTSF